MTKQNIHLFTVKLQTPIFTCLILQRTHLVLLIVFGKLKIDFHEQIISIFSNMTYNISKLIMSTVFNI